MAKDLSLTRQELYDKVWSVPMYKLAKEYGLSDVGLAKLCKRHGIPRPGVAYWPQVARGQNARKEPLPAPEPGQSEAIEFTVEADVNDAKVANRYEDTRSALAQIQEKAATFSSGSSNRLKHPLVLELHKIRRELGTDAQGRLSARRDSFIDVRATPECWDRALRVMDTVLLAAESFGYGVRIEPQKGTVLKVLGEDIPIGLKEKILRSDSPPPDKSHHKFYPFGKAYQYTPTGLLTLSIKYIYVEKTRINWTETARARLEDQIGKFFAGLVEVVASLRVREEEWKERERRSAEASRIREERAQQEQRERERVQELMRDAENWKKASMLRAYIAAKVKKEEETVAGGSSSKDFLEWLQWANKCADSLDPLTRESTEERKDSLQLPEAQKTQVQTNHNPTG